MKRSIEWHEQCLMNYRRSLDDRLRRLTNMEKEYERGVAEYEVMAVAYNQDAAKLAEAKRRGLDGYDSERFMKKRK